MAMFEFKDSEDIKTSDSTTTSDVFMRGERVKRVEAENCHVLPQRIVEAASEEPESLVEKIRLWIVENIIVTIIASVGSVMVAAIIAYFNLS